VSGIFILLKQEILIILTFLAYLGVAWIYALILSVIPLASKNQFVLEVTQSFCTFDYIDQSLSTRIVMILTNIFGFYIPITVMTICYLKIIRSLKNDEFKNNQIQIINRANSRMLQSLSTITSNFKRVSNITDIGDFEDKRKKFSVEILLIKNTVILICVFCLSWGPYSIISLIAQFSNHREYLVTPLSTSIPALIGKSSTVITPIIYILRNKVFVNNIRRNKNNLNISNNNSI
jgi:hypothetical protein